MAGRIYLLNEDAKLVPMEESQYDSEDLLQELLANYPDLLAGEQINPDEPRRWLLISREMPVSDGEGGEGRWFLDHLFVDQEGIPTLVEVKRSSDTRVRREVVGQMLDYAANAVVYWPLDKIQSRFDLRCQEADQDPVTALEEFLGVGENIGDFWNSVKTNLQAGRIRLVFVGDSIPSELKRIVEFLNEQMDPAEVLAIEVKQFVGKGVKTLVPRVLGQTEISRRKRSGGSPQGVDWDESKFLEAIKELKGDIIKNLVKDLIDWVSPKVNYLWWGKGAFTGGLVPVIKMEGTDYHPIKLATNGFLVFRFDWLKKKPGFREESERRELFEKIKEIPGVTFSDRPLTGMVKIPFETMQDPLSLGKIKDCISWIVKKINPKKQ